MAGVLKETIARLQAIEISTETALPERERLALQDRLNLTLASFYLDDTENGAAMATFRRYDWMALCRIRRYLVMPCTANQNEFGLSTGATDTF